MMWHHADGVSPAAMPSATVEYVDLLRSTRQFRVAAQQSAVDLSIHCPPTTKAIQQEHRLNTMAICTPLREANARRAGRTKRAEVLKMSAQDSGLGPLVCNKHPNNNPPQTVCTTETIIATIK